MPHALSVLLFVLLEQIRIQVTVPPPKLQEFSGNLAAASLSSAYPKSLFQASGLCIQQLPEVISLKYRVQGMAHLGQLTKRQVALSHDSQNIFFGQLVEKGIQMRLPGTGRNQAGQHAHERVGVNAVSVRYITGDDSGPSFDWRVLHGA
jgi:hypothetical protein